MVNRIILFKKYYLLFLQVVMGYSHSLVIARQDTEQEQERLKKLPEYNPRTIWFGNFFLN